MTKVVEAAGDSLARWLDLVCPRLPPALVGEESHARMGRALEAVPAGLVARFGFECRLDDVAAEADVLFSADVKTGGLEMLAGRHPLVELPPPAPEWEPLVRLCRRREPGSMLARAADDLWVELDTAAGENPPPSVFFGLRVAGLPGDPAASMHEVLEAGFEALLGQPLAHDTRAALGSVIELLPARARVFQAGAMLSRPGSPIRICLDNLAREQIVSLVEAVRGRPEALALGAALDGLTAPAGAVRPGLDVGAGVGERIGLECYGNLPPLLERLTHAGLCVPAKRDALLACEGRLREGDAEPWPAHLAGLSALLGVSARSVVGWNVHHVKVVCDRGVPVGAKAYVVVWHGWER